MDEQLGARRNEAPADSRQQLQQQTSAYGLEFKEPRNQQIIEKTKQFISSELESLNQKNSEYSLHMLAKKLNAAKTEANPSTAQAKGSQPPLQQGAYQKESGESDQQELGEQEPGQQELGQQEPEDRVDARE